MAERESYQKGFFDCLNYILYKIIPRVKTISEFKKELENLESAIREMSAEEIAQKFFL